MQKSRKESFDRLLASGYQFPDQVGDPEEEYIRRYEPPFTIIQIRAAIESLDEPDRSIFLEYHIGYSTQSELAVMYCRDQCFVSRSLKRSKLKILKILNGA